VGHRPAFPGWMVAPGHTSPLRPSGNPWPVIVTRGVREREHRGTPLRHLSRRRSDQRLRRHEVPPAVLFPGARDGILIGQGEPERWTRRSRRRQDGREHGSPRCLKIFPTTSGSVRNASTIIGTRCAVVEQRGQVSASRWRTRRSNCAHGTRRRGVGSMQVEPFPSLPTSAASPSSPISGDAVSCA